MNKKTITAKSKLHLCEIIQEEMKLYGNKCNLNHIDISQLNDLSQIFASLTFNGDISSWDVSNVTNMDFMFTNSLFTGDLSNWTPYKVENFFDSVFLGSSLKDLPYWANYESLEERKLAIDNYVEKKYLNDTLNEKLESKITINRNKIKL